MDITYQINIIPDIEVIIDLFDHAGYHPTGNDGDIERLRKMHVNANLLITAWDNELLVGISRSLTDFCYCCYLSDLAVRDDYKGKGIGKKLVSLTKEQAGEQCKLILHSSNESVDFYTNIGMEQISNAFIIRRTK